MNKSFVLVLAICLVTVQGFVKRDAPQTPDSNLESIKNTVSNMIDEAAKLLNPDAIKKHLEEASATINDAINKLKPTEAPKA